MRNIMSRTDNTRPFAIQSADPAVPSRMVHDSHQMYAPYYVKVPVTFDELVGVMIGSIANTTERSLYSAVFGSVVLNAHHHPPIRPSHVGGSILDVTPNDNRFKRFARRYLCELATLDRGDAFTGSTMIGYHNQYHVIQVDREYCSEDCRHEAYYYGGINKSDAWHKLGKKMDHRERRYAARRAIRRMVDPDDLMINLVRADRGGLSWFD